MNARETAMAAATGVFVVSALAWAVVVKPTVERWNAATDRVSTLSDQLDKATALVKRRGELEVERARIDHALAPNDGLGPLERPDAHAEFLDHLDELSRAAGIGQNSPGEIKLVRAEPFDAYAELRFELRARAPLRQIQDFLVRMAASDWYLRVKALQVQPRPDGTVEADMTLVGLASQDALDSEDLPGGKRRPR